MNAPAEHVWTEARWRALEARTRAAMLAAPGDDAAWTHAVRASRTIMRAYTTSFFIVSRFLPRPKRDRVEVIYANVRWPDEMVDTFPLPAAERRARLAAWSAAYEQALATPDWRDAIREGVPCFLAAFVRLAREASIPPDDYRAFLAAMRRDIEPRPFDTLDDLIQHYIHGSAIVVGHFLTHVYGATRDRDFPRALESARDLGIGLQLTNFLRDVAEDHRRGRMYLPRDFLQAEGLAPETIRIDDPGHVAALGHVVARLASAAAGYYHRARANLNAFAPDSRIAIAACIEVYGLLNERIRLSDRGIAHRASVPFREKWRVLPRSKYWRIPLAFLEPGVRP